LLDTWRVKERADAGTEDAPTVNPLTWARRTIEMQDKSTLHQPVAARLGPVQFGVGISRLNAVTYLYQSFVYAMRTWLAEGRPVRFEKTGAGASALPEMAH
jgi:hypothetical protein